MNGYVTELSQAQSQVEVLEAENAELWRENVRLGEEMAENCVSKVEATNRITEAVAVERERADKLQAELDRLRQGIRSEVERLRERAEQAGRLSKWGIDEDATAGEEIGLDHAADRLESLLGDES